MAVVLLDAAEPLSEQDQRVIGEVVDAGRALVLAFNKWDLLDEDRRDQLDQRDRPATSPGWPGRRGSTSRPAPAARSDGSPPALRIALASWDRRISTGQLNTWLTEVVAPHPAAAARRQGAAGAVRDPGRHPSAPVRAVHHRLPRGRLPPLPRTPAARGLRASRAPRSRSRSASGRSANAEVLSGLAGRAAIRFSRCRGTWRSLVAHLTGGQGVTGSNPVVPTS